MAVGSGVIGGDPRGGIVPVFVEVFLIGGAVRLNFGHDFFLLVGVGGGSGGSKVNDFGGSEVYNLVRGGGTEIVRDAVRPLTLGSRHLKYLSGEGRGSSGKRGLLPAYLLRAYLIRS